ncbi:uncharacterized protein LOC144097148 isoform X1 [Amblyomma americanum]
MPNSAVKLALGRECGFQVAILRTAQDSDTSVCCREGIPAKTIKLLHTNASSVTMSSLQCLALLVLCCIQPFDFASEMETRWPEVLVEGPPDAFEVFEAVLYAVAVRDVNTDPMLKCLTARRTDLDLEVPSATYVWSLNAGEDQPRKNATLYFTPAPSDATARLVVNSDVDHPDYVRYLYTDEECGIMEVHYFGYQCTLWVPEIVGDTIPEHCLWVHAMICGEGVPLYDKKVCTENLE